MALRSEKPPTKPKRHRWRRTAAHEAIQKMGARRDAYELAGYGPGDAYTGVWDGITEIRRLQQEVEKGLAHPKTGTKKKAALVKRRDELRQELIETFLKILPYERSRLTQSKVDATTTSTTFVRPDLSGLSDDELDLLEKITLKLGGAASPGAGGDAPRPVVDIRRGLSPPRAMPRLTPAATR